jgi:hypothetical protein
MKGLRWNEDQLNQHLNRRPEIAGAQPPAAARSKPTAPVAPPEDGKRRLQALGRLRDGTMNQTEARYAEKLEAERVAGRVAWWKFEAIRLKLAPNTFLTVDFFVMYADGRLEAIDVKGAKAIVQDDAKAKAKIAADMYPWPFKFAYPRKVKDGGGWDEEVIG